MRGEKLALRRDRIAAEQILDLNRPGGRSPDMARCDLLERGQRLHQHGEGSSALIAARRSLRSAEGMASSTF